MPLQKKLTELKNKLKHYEDRVPVNNMGKWSRSVAIESYKTKIAEIEAKQLKSKKWLNELLYIQVQSSNLPQV